MRAAVAAVGAAVGMVVAVPVGARLVTFLTERVGAPIVEGVLDDGIRDGLSWVEAAFAAIGLVIVGILVAFAVIAALVVPLFVVLPTAGSAVALRLAGAGLIMRSSWLSVAVAVVVMLVVVGLAEAGLDVWGRWWLWVFVAALAAFAGRFVVEMWDPRRAGESAPVAAGRRWRVLVGVWLVLLVLAAVSGTALYLAVA